MRRVGGRLHGGRFGRETREGAGRNSRSKRRRRQVFLNLPFDNIRGYESCFLAYVAGLLGLGLVPRSVLEIPSGGRDRLTRIFRLMRECRYSIHDLSRIEVRGGRYPRFNMPLETGMATALSLSRKPPHDRYVFASRYRLVQQVASDLGGVDVYEHRSTPAGVLSAIRNAFVRRRRPVSRQRQMEVYRQLRRWVSQERKRSRRGLFEPALFHDILVAGRAIADQYAGG